MDYTSVTLNWTCHFHNPATQERYQLGLEKQPKLLSQLKATLQELGGIKVTKAPCREYLN